MATVFETTRFEQKTCTNERDENEYMIRNQKFSIPSRYVLKKIVGYGAYGVVVAGIDKETGEEIAIKKVSNCFADEVDAKRVLRELKLLAHFDHENILYLNHILPPANLANFNDIYIVSELMETDLHRIIYSKQKLSDEHVKYFIYQTLLALKHIHAAGVIHRDLKPQNLLINSDCQLKLCDFGLARSIQEDDNLTEYVVTRWYRAPEIILSSGYDVKADVWSLGCIFAELLLRRPLFPGNDYIEMAQMIFQRVGSKNEDLSFITLDRALDFVRDMDLPENRPDLIRLFKDSYISPPALRVLEKMLRINPSERISVEEALRDPYFEQVRDEQDEHVETTPFFFEHENKQLCREEVKELMFKEVAKYHAGARKILLEAHRENKLIFPLTDEDFIDDI